MNCRILWSLILVIAFVTPGFSQAEASNRFITGYRLAALEFGGSRIFPREKLAAQFPIKVGEPYDNAKIHEGLQAVRKMFDDAGYIDFRYTPWLDVDNTARTVSVSFDLWQGSQYIVRSLIFLGQSSLNDGDVRSILRDSGLEEGKIFYPPQLEGAVKALNKRLGEERLTSKDCKISKLTGFPGEVDITIRLKPDGR